MIGPPVRERDVAPDELLNALPCAVVVRDSSGRLVSANRPYREIVGILPPSVVKAPADLAPLRIAGGNGRPIEPSEWPPTAALRDREAHNLTVSVIRPDGRKAWLRVDSKAIEDAVLGTLTITTYLGITDRGEPEQEPAAAVTRATELIKLLRNRQQQQAGVAELGRLALVGTGPQRLMEHAVRLVASTLNADRVRVLEVMPNGKDLLLRAGVGWRAECIGSTTINLENTQVGYLFHSNEPLIIEDFRTDDRFRVSQLLQEHPVRSGIRAVIRGESAPFGELAAYTKRHRHFTKEDTVFMRAVANVLAEAFIRLKAEQAREETLRRLHEVDEARQRLLQRLTDVVEEERKRVANDIHDDSLQVLAGLGMRLQLVAQKIEDPELRKSIQEVNSALSSAGKRLRKLIFDLRPDTLEFGLGPALRFFFEQTATGTDPKLVVVDKLSEDPAAHIQLLIYRVCQEALHNVRKHARATHVNVSLSESKAGILVQIDDDGIGFDLARGSAPGHIGLIAMRERVQLAGGRTTIASQPGKGTSVEFWLPRPEAV